MPQPEFLITEDTYEVLLGLNREHGRTLFTDVLVIETIGLQVFEAPPKYLPKGVAPKGVSLGQGTSGFRDVIANPVPAFRIGRQEPVEGIGSILHGKPIHYEKIYDEQGKLRSVRRYDEGGSEGLFQAGSHYHVLSPFHGGREGRYRAVIGLGDRIRNFPMVFDSLSRQALLYAGDINGHVEYSAYQGIIPPAEIGIEMLRAFILGLREGAQALQRTDVLIQAENFLDRLP